MTELIPLAACILIALGIGSNDTSNALGICIGCGIISYRRAIVVFGFLVLVGILVQGAKVMDTVGRNLLEVNLTILTISLSVSAVLIILSNWRRLPLSTHQVIIGSLVGAGVAYEAPVNWLSLTEIVLSWVISPLVALCCGNLFYRLMEKTLSKLPLFRIERILRVLLLMSGFLIAYNTGANELATILGPVIYAGMTGKPEASVAGALFVFLGAWLLSHRVIETVGKGITALDPFSGFAAQFGAGACVLFFTFLGMPISTTYCVIGAISGVGMVKGMGTVRVSLLKKILMNWILAPSVGFFLCYGIARLVV